MKLINVSKFIPLFFLFAIQNLLAWQYDGRHGWPVQSPPKYIIECISPEFLNQRMVLESLSGLAAQAVNEGKFNEMVWIKTNNACYNNIYIQTQNVLGVGQPKEMGLWELVDYLKTKKVVKGYVLYKMDKKRPDAYTSYPDVNYSSNVATVYSGLLKGVLIDESLEKEAKQHGLVLLKDARKENLCQCFEKNKDKLNNCSALSIPPIVPNLRDYAICHKLMLYADNKEIIDDVLSWVRPLSPILGWGCGDEFEFTSKISRWGHFNTATNWCENLPLISSVGKKVKLKKVFDVSPKSINYSDSISCHSYVMSDGDNMQWTMGSFIDSKVFMGHPDVPELGLSWTLCPINLSIISPFTWNALADKHNQTFSYIEYGGGYQYPDLFAINRPNRKDLLREFARRINYHLKELNISVFGFICIDVSSSAAQEAFQIYAEEIDCISGMLAVQYFPYELNGEVYWKKNNIGIEIPIITARYSLWNEVNKYRPRAGTPEYVAAIINRDVIEAQAKNENILAWTIVHAWSDYSKTSTSTLTPSYGVNPVKASKSMMLNCVHSVSASELIWQIRMKFHKEKTMQILKDLN